MYLSAFSRLFWICDSPSSSNVCRRMKFKIPEQPGTCMGALSLPSSSLLLLVFVTGTCISHSSKSGRRFASFLRHCVQILCPLLRLRLGWSAIAFSVTSLKPDVFLFPWTPWVTAGCSLKMNCDFCSLGHLIEMTLEVILQNTFSDRTKPIGDFPRGI